LAAAFLVEFSADKNSWCLITSRRFTVDPSARKEPAKKTPDKSPWVVAAEGTQLALAILLGFYIGHRIDKVKGTFPWFTLILSGLGFAVGLYNFILGVLKK